MTYRKGAILVDGIDVRNVRQKELRKHVGAVLQDPFLFSGTIASNIRLHEEQINDEQIRKAAEPANRERIRNPNLIYPGQTLVLP